MLAGLGTFLVVGVAALIVMATMASPARPVPAPAATPPPKAQPRLAPLGEAPPDGVDQDSAYRRRQIEAFISQHLDKPYTLVDATEASGSQRAEYCGSARPKAGGAIRYWSIVLWSHAPMEHSFSKTPRTCDAGRVLVQAGKTLTFDEAQALIAAATPPQAPPTLMAAPGADAPMTALIDKVSTYAVLIGRGAACGVDVSGPSERVGAWMDRVAPPGSSAQLTLLPMFMQQSRYHAARQASGQSPDACSTVQLAVQTYPWP